MLVYSTQNASYQIYRLCVVCRYPSVAAGRPPSASAQETSRYCQAEPESAPQRQEALPYDATRNMERVGGKHEDWELQGKAQHSRIRWMRKKRETRKESADGLDPEKYPVPSASAVTLPHP